MGQLEKIILFVLCFYLSLPSLLYIIMFVGRNSRLSKSPVHNRAQKKCGTAIPNNCKTLTVMSALEK